MDSGPFEESITLDMFPELILGKKMVVNTINFTISGRSRCRSNYSSEFGAFVDQSFTEGGFT